MKYFQQIIVAVGILLSATRAQTQAIDHGHLNAGAFDPIPGSQLFFDNGNDFATFSDYVKSLTYTNAGTYAGYYQGNITLTALATSEANAGPVANAALPGSFIQAQLVSVDGPAGGAFSFWEAGATNPTITVLSGQTGTNLWKLTSGTGAPGADPYGHIHGRRMTVNKVGFYTIGFKLFDTSTNSASHGPLHLPSDVIYVYFQAGENISHIEPDVDHAHVSFPAPLGSKWQLETATVPGTNAIWTAVGTPIAGDDRLHEVYHYHTVQGQRFYRVKSASP